MSTELLATIAKVRRDMPRNSGVMSLCDELERLLTTRVEPGPKRDRTEYMREYMRNRRRAERAKQ